MTPTDKIIAEIDERRSEHDGVTILGGEPFDQAESLEKLVFGLKEKNYHFTVYTGYLLEDLIEKGSRTIERILSGTDLLIDGPFKRELAKNAGEYRGSSNQRVISEPYRLLRLETGNMSPLVPMVGRIGGFSLY